MYIGPRTSHGLRPLRQPVRRWPQFRGMKLIITISAFVFYFQGFSQVVPNVAIDSLLIRMFPIYSEALKSGIYDLPRDTSWRNLKTYETNAISFKIPDKWLNLGGLSSVVEMAFDASGLYFPETFNDRPILVGLFLLNQRGNSLNDAKDSALKDYRANPDRVFESGFSDSVYNYVLPKDKKCYVLRTRFLRNSNQLNQSRYDLIFFSEKLKKAYSMMLSVQYADPSYSFDRINSLEAFAARIFSQIVPK